MENKPIDGLAHDITGTEKEQVGQATGTRSKQVEGNIEKNAGKAEQMIDALVDRMVEGEDKR